MESRNAAAAAAAADTTTTNYEHLRALLSLENPTCQICAEDMEELNHCSADEDATAGGPAKVQGKVQVRLVPMPHCQCRTILASVHVRPSDLPLPPTDDATNDETTDDAATATFLEQLLYSQPCLSSAAKTTNTTNTANKRMGVFTPRHPPTCTLTHRQTCTTCLPQWTQSSNDVQKYTYNDDPDGNEMCFTNEVKCTGCGRVFAKRTVERLMGRWGGGGGGSSCGESKEKEEDEWTKCVENTAQVVRWADSIRAWAKRELTRANNTSDNNNPEDDIPNWEQQLTPQQSHLRSILLSIVQSDTSPSLVDGVHRQEVQHGEMKRELMQRDPKFAQEVQDMEYVRQLAEEEERARADEERRRAEADERMARELAEKEREGSGASGDAQGDGSAARGAAAASATAVPALFASQQRHMRQREEEEKKSEELARKMQQQWQEEERRERDRREKRDAKLARKLHNADQREQKGRKRKAASDAVFGEQLVRKSPFEAHAKPRQQQPATPKPSTSKQDDVVDITDSPTKAAGDNSDDEYERIPPSLAAKMNEMPHARDDKEISKTEKKKDEVHDLVTGSGDGHNGENEVDNNDDEPPLFSLTATPVPTRKPVDTSARKKPPPPSPPAPNRKPPPMPENATPRHRTGSKNGADFSADKKKEEDWDEKNDSDLEFLIDMGFNWTEAKSCYLDADKNVEKAAAMLSSAMEERERAKKRG